MYRDWFYMVGQYIPTRASGYLHGSADVGVWLINRMVGLLVPFLTTKLFALVAKEQPTSLSVPKFTNSNSILIFKISLKSQKRFWS
jgi:hypothetical protein